MISVIAAVARDGTIGHKGRIPWHYPEDLAHFRATTMGHTVVMGRKTWESLTRPLDGRRNIVISRNPTYTALGAEVMGSLAAVIASNPPDAHMFVIGGSDLFREALQIAERAYITFVDLSPDGDTKFPEMDRIWVPFERRPGDTAGLTFVTLARLHEQ